MPHFHNLIFFLIWVEIIFVFLINVFIWWSSILYLYRFIVNRLTAANRFALTKYINLALWNIPVLFTEVSTQL